MRAVISVIGKDMTGILARVSSECASANANVIEVSQTILQELFAMVMIVDIQELNQELTAFSSHMDQIGEELGMVIHVMHEDIFQAMHRI